MSSICAIRDSGHDSRKRRKGDFRVQPRARARARRGGGYFAIIRLSCDFLLANRLSVERKEGKEGGRWIGTASSKRGPINGNGREGR